MPDQADHGASESFIKTVQELTVRERQALDAMVIGESAKATARRLGISPRSVQVYRSRIHLKLGLTTNEVIRLAAKSGLA